MGENFTENDPSPDANTTYDSKIARNLSASLGLDGKDLCNCKLFRHSMSRRDSSVSNLLDSGTPTRLDIRYALVGMTRKPNALFYRTLFRALLFIAIALNLAIAVLSKTEKQVHNDEYNHANAARCYTEPAES